MNEYSNIFKYSDRFQCSTTSSRNGSLNFWTEGMFHLRHLRSARVAMFRCIRTCGSWVSGSQGGSQLGFSSQNLMGQLLCLCLMPMHFMTHRQSHIASLDWKMRSAARDALVDRPRMPQRLGWSQRPFRYFFLDLHYVMCLQYYDRCSSYTWTEASTYIMICSV
jgi:hypothetical protein